MLQPLLCSAGCLISAAETWLATGPLGHIVCTSLGLCVQKGRLFDGEVAAGLSQGAQGTLGCVADVRTSVEAHGWKVSCPAPWRALLVQGFVASSSSWEGGLWSSTVSWEGGLQPPPSCPAQWQQTLRSVSCLHTCTCAHALAASSGRGSLVLPRSAGQAAVINPGHREEAVWRKQGLARGAHSQRGSCSQPC